MGNAMIKELEDTELGRAHLEGSSPKVISPNHVTYDTTRLRQRGEKWYAISKEEEEEEEKEKGSRKQEEKHSFTIRNPGFFKSAGPQILMDDKDQVVAVLQYSSASLKSGKTLIYRPQETFSGQQVTPEVYKIKKADQPMYLYACIKTLGISKCDAGYCLLKVNEVYNDSDFAQFEEPQYKASKVNGVTKFAATIAAGDDPSNLLGKLGHLHGGGGAGRAIEAEIADGVDLLAAICLGLSVNHLGTSAGGLAGAGVV